MRGRECQLAIAGADPCYELASYFTELFLAFDKTLPKKYR